MKILQKLGVVVSTVFVFLILTRLILQLIFTHNQGFFTVENLLFALILPVILVFWKRSATFQSLALTSAGYTVALTLIDYLLVTYGDWPGTVW